MILGHDSLIHPEDVPLAPVHRFQVRRLRQLAERVDEGSAGEHGGEGAPLGGELLRKLRGVLRQRHREVFLGIEDEQLTLGPGGGGAVGGHGRGW